LWRDRIAVASLLSLAGAGDASVAAPRFAYAVNAYDATISQFVVDGSTGQLRHNGWAATGRFPSCIVVHPSGKFAFVAEQTGMKISVYDINPTNGRLTPIKGSPFDSKQVSPFWAVTDPEGKFLFIAGRNSNNIAAMAIDPQTGALSNVEGSPYPGGELPRSVAIHPSGKFVYMASINHDAINGYRVDSATGTLKPVPGSPIAAGDAPQYMRIHSNGKLLFLSNWNDRDISVFAIDEVNGALTKKNRVPLAEGVYPFGLGMAPGGRFLYVANWFGGTLAFSVNAGSGELTPVPNSPFASKGGLPVQVELDPAGTNAYVTNYDSHNITRYKVDAASGALHVQETTMARIGPRSMAFVTGDKPVEYVPRFAYVANERGNSLSIFTIDGATGALKPNGKIATGARPVGVAVDPLGRFVFVANHDSDNVSAYAVQRDGSLAAVPGSPFKAGKNPNAIAVDSNGRNLHVSNRVSKTMTVYDIDARSGALSELTLTELHAPSPYALAAEPADLVIHPSDRGVFVPYADSNKVAGFKYFDDGIMVVDLEHYGSPFALGANVTRIGWEPNGRYLFRLDARAGSIEPYAINETTTGLREADDTKPVATGKNPVALAFHPNARFMYVLNRDSEDVYAYPIDPDTAAIGTMLGSVKTGKKPSAIAVDGSGRFLYVVNSESDSVSMYAIDRGTGKLMAAGAVESGERPVALSIFTEIR
jgi:6-phosphogluconolactonase (cycloisomerase 2 family)